LEREQNKLAIISKYLPEQEIDKVVSVIIERVDDVGLKDMGRIMSKGIKGQS